jgi:hypothetical protein
MRLFCNVGKQQLNPILSTLDLMHHDRLASSPILQSVTAGYDFLLCSVGCFPFHAQFREHGHAQAAPQPQELQPTSAIASAAVDADADELMQDAQQPQGQIWQQQQQQHHLPHDDASVASADEQAEQTALPTRSSLSSPFCIGPANMTALNTNAEQQQQQQPAAAAAGHDSELLPQVASSSASSTGKTGHMPPPRRLLPYNDSSSAGSSAAAAAATLATTTAGAAGAGAGSRESSPHCADLVTLGKEKAKSSPELYREPSLSVGVLLAGHSTISSAASLEGWLPAEAAAAVAAAAAAASAAAASGVQGGSPRSAAAAAAALIRNSSTASTASIARQGSLVFGLPPRPATTTLESAGSFAGWPSTQPAAQQQQQQQQPLLQEGSFSWPRVPARRTVSTDSLQLDIQVRCGVSRG